MNFASRSAAQTGIITVINRTNAGTDSGSEPLISWYMIAAGATPKLTTSARESSSFPISEYAFSSLAVNPSRKSKIMAASINQEAFARSPLNAKMTEMNPAARFSDVMKLGICLNIDLLSEGNKIKINFLFIIRFATVTEKQ